MTIEDTQQRIAELETALADNDAQRTAHIAHSLAGIALSVGGLELSACAKRVEIAAGSARLDLCRNLLLSLNTALQRLEPALRQTDWSSSDQREVEYNQSSRMEEK
ncbi:MAG: Hpt domain-containing protein [Candidatus Competibacteraceae bacterium]|nr:Hpt domain-containing protein [Candidatus Competibacteraceae bacterium]